MKGTTKQYVSQYSLHKKSFPLRISSVPQFLADLVTFKSLIENYSFCAVTQEYGILSGQYILSGVATTRANIKDGKLYNNSKQN